MYDVIIIGAGPSGLYMGSLLENKYKYIIIEKSEFIGGQCNFYKNKFMYDVAGISKITGQQYIELLKENIDDKKILLKNGLIDFKEENSIVKVSTENHSYKTKILIISHGHGLIKFSKPSIENMEKYEHKQIFYFPDHNMSLLNKKILIFGGGDTALDAIEFLLPFTKDITLIHRRNIFKAQENKLQLLNTIKTYIGYSLQNLNGDDDKLHSVIINNNDENISLSLDYVFFCYGYDTTESPTPFPVNVNTMLINDSSRVFAIGSCNQYAHKRNLISSSIFESEIVLHQIKELI